MGSFLSTMTSLRLLIFYSNKQNGKNVKIEQCLVWSECGVRGFEEVFILGKWSHSFRFIIFFRLQLKKFFLKSVKS